NRRTLIPDIAATEPTSDPACNLSRSLDKRMMARVGACCWFTDHPPCAFCACCASIILLRVYVFGVHSLTNRRKMFEPRSRRPGTSTERPAAFQKKRLLVSPFGFSAHPDISGRRRFNKKALSQRKRASNS